jgi:hypothetical protein
LRKLGLITENPHTRFGNPKIELYQMVLVEGLNMCSILLTREPGDTRSNVVLADALELEKEKKGERGFCTGR